MKIIIETGSVSHTTSFARVWAKYRNGDHAGEALSKVKELRKRVQYDRPDGGGYWATSEFDIPEGTLIEVGGKGQTGPRGIYQHRFHRVYLVDPNAPILEEIIHVGLRKCVLKGRLSLFEDYIASREAANNIDMEEGF